MSATTRFGHLGGGLLTAVGALGLAVTGLATPLAPSGQRLLVLEVDPAQNLAHLALGLTMVLGAAGAPRTAATTTLVATVALGTLGLVGLLAGPEGNPLALGAWNNALHLVLAGWGALATLLTVRDTTATPEATAAMRRS